MQSIPKRTTQVNVRMATEDFALMRKAADAVWPGAVLTKAAIVLGMAKLGAKSVLKKKAGKR